MERHIPGALLWHFLKWTTRGNLLISSTFKIKLVKRKKNHLKNLIWNEIVLKLSNFKALFHQKSKLVQVF